MGPSGVHSQFGSKSVFVSLSASYVLPSYQILLSCFVYFVSFMALSDPLFYFFALQTSEQSKTNIIPIADKEIRVLRAIVGPMLEHGFLTAIIVSLYYFKKEYRVITWKLVKEEIFKWMVNIFNAAKELLEKFWREASFWFGNAIATYFAIVNFRSDMVKVDVWKLIVRHWEMGNKTLGKGVESTDNSSKEMRRRGMIIT